MTTPPVRPVWRSPKLLVVVALGVALVIALAIVLSLDGGGSGAGRPGSPQAAAQAWGRAALTHNTVALKRLSCSPGTQGFGTYGLLFSGSGVHAGAARATGADRWAVPVTTTGPGGGTSLHVTVIKQHGNYVVC